MDDSNTADTKLSDPVLDAGEWDEVASAPGGDAVNEWDDGAAEADKCAADTVGGDVVLEQDNRAAESVEGKPRRTSRVRRCSLTRRPDGAFRVSVPAAWVYGPGHPRALKHNARVSRVLRRDDGSVVRDKRTAERMAADLAEQLMPAVPGSRTPFGRTAREGEQISEMLERFVASYDGRDKRTAAGVVGGVQRLRLFLTSLGTRAPVTVRDLTRAHAAAFREWVDREPRDNGEAYAAGTKDRMIEVAMRFLNWSVEQGALDLNPWKAARLARFKSNRMRDRVLADDKRILFKNERERLYAACRSTDERLMLQLLCLAGLRNGEVAHLTWSDYKRHESIKRLHIRRKGDWIPKTGERLVPLYYTIVTDLMEQWRVETPFGTGDDDRIFRSRGRADCEGIEVPRRWIERLQKVTGIPFTPLVGRHTACSLFPLYAKRLTGREFSELEHAQLFGHDFKTSQRYYISASLVDLATKEGFDAGGGAPVSPTDAEADDAQLITGALTPARAKAILRTLMKAADSSLIRTGTAAGVSGAAVCRWLQTGKSVPLWWYPAVDFLTL